MCLLQEKLIIARSNQEKSVSIMTEMVHEIKFRLMHYSRQFGEVDRSLYEKDRDYRDDRYDRGRDDD